MVSPDSGFMTLVVECASGKGQRMEMQLPYDDGYDDGPGRQGTKVASGLVGRAIGVAIRSGWAPALRAAPFKLEFDREVRGDR